MEIQSRGACRRVHGSELGPDCLAGASSKTSRSRSPSLSQAASEVPSVCRKARSKCGAMCPSPETYRQQYFSHSPSDAGRGGTRPDSAA
ncbi:hypothetical protein Y1Q_0022118 [Alligator mississippiensis]|uniref:Uncharacterized protein n=1 Tax=Alligator mississippiensis TaxID=8496 RepID=A0A151MMF8_ALLMI|nr:hypothetical protein Y1Q_0022118 [Alligator mississippiensis]